MYSDLHIWANKLKRYSFSELEKLNSVKNGIYLLFEKGEKFESLDRIVRVGSHPSQNRFYDRLTDHFMNKHRSSIVRKHIGRCFLNKENDSYIKVWDLSNKEVKKGSPGEKLVDFNKEHAVESRVSDYLNNFSISVIPGLNDTDRRMQLESSLIATLNLSSRKYISSNWLGKSHPDTRIVQSGLWNIQGLNGETLNADDFRLIQEKTKQ
jgi:hypothetical protein